MTGEKRLQIVTECSCPHLAILDPELFDRVSQSLGKASSKTTTYKAVKPT